MKRKWLLCMLALVIVLALAGCKKKDTGDSDTSGTNASQEGQSGEESRNEEESSSAADHVDVTGMESLGKMYYTVPEGWEKQDSAEGSSLYKYENGSSMASASIGFQEETRYTAESMIAAYESSIQQNISMWDSLEKETVGDYTWNHYSFRDGTIQSGVIAEIYLYSSGEQTLYFEFAATSDVDLSHVIPGVLESIVIP